MTGIQGSRLRNRWENAWTRWNGTWVLEITAIAFSIATFFALCVVLIVGNNKTVWSGVTLNAYVSILATASKLAALFALSSAIGQAKWTVFWHRSGSLLDFEAIDLASRGALGCAQLLLQTRSVALLGALAFILAFAFDPFAQQLVQYHTSTDFRNETAASVPIKGRYSGGNLFRMYGTAIGATMLNAFQPNADYAMQAAILSGLIQSKDMVTQQLPVTCPSGNCQWPLIESLAVCSTCKDLKSLVKKSTSIGSPSFTLLSTGPVALGNVTRFSLPNGLRLDNMDDQKPQLMMTTFGTALPQETNAMKTVDTMIWSMTMMKANASTVTATWPHLDVASKECALYYCVKQYNTTVNANRIEEIESEVISIRRARASWQPQSYIGVNASQQAAFVNSIAWMNTDAGAVWNSINRTDLMLGDRYNISNDAVKSISAYFWDKFQAQTSQSPNITGYWMSLGDGPDFSPSIMQILNAESDLEGRFAILAKSMSNAIRTHSAAPRYEYGAVGQQITKYRIEWPWISLPIVVVLASLLQLLVTMKASRKLPLWKSSTLASLSRGPYVKDIFDGAETIAAMRAAAAQDKVYLFEEDLPSSKARAEEYLLSISSPSLSNWTNESPTTPHRAQFDSIRTHQRNISDGSNATLVNNSQDSPYSPPTAHFKEVPGHRRNFSNESSSTIPNEAVGLLISEDAATTQHQAFAEMLNTRLRL